MTGPLDELAALRARLAAGAPDQPPERRHRIPKPIYLLSVDEPDERSLVLIVRAGGDGIMRATIVTPQWHELEEGWDRPHLMDVAVPLADSYADALATAPSR